MYLLAGDIGGTKTILGIYKFDGNWKKLRNKIRTLNFKIPSSNQNIDFIAHMWEYCEYGYPFPPSEILFEEDNIRKLIKSIENKVKLYSNDII